MTTWVGFRFESNHYFAWVGSPQEWEKVKEAYRDRTTDELLDKARVCPYADYPKYGFVSECSGDKTLRQFFTENRMTP